MNPDDPNASGGTLLDQLNHAARDDALAAVEIRHRFLTILVRATNPEPNDAAELLYLGGRLGMTTEHVRSEVAHFMAMAERDRARAEIAALPKWYRLAESAAAILADAETDDGQELRSRFLRGRYWQPRGDAWEPSVVEMSALSAEDAIRAELSGNLAALGFAPIPRDDGPAAE